MSDTQTEKKIRKRGSRQQVVNGEALMTSGGLTKDKLILNEKTGKICSMAEIQRGIDLSSKMKERRKPVVISPVDAAPDVTVTIIPKQPRKSRAKKTTEAPVDAVAA